MSRLWVLRVRQMSVVNCEPLGYCAKFIRVGSFVNRVCAFVRVNLVVWRVCLVGFFVTC